MLLEKCNNFPPVTICTRSTQVDQEVCKQQLCHPFLTAALHRSSLEEGQDTHTPITAMDKQYNVYCFMMACCYDVTNLPWAPVGRGGGIN